MKIEHATPPMWNEIDAAFKVAGKSVLIAWEDTIYLPMGGTVSPELMAHETVHGQRQRLYVGIHGNGVHGWWRQYIADPAFRLSEEIPAHQAEYREYCRLSGKGQKRFARALALRLCGPLYGRMIPYVDALATILTPPLESPS